MLKKKIVLHPRQSGKTGLYGSADMEAELKRLRVSSGRKAILCNDNVIRLGRVYNG